MKGKFVTRIEKNHGTGHSGNNRTLPNGKSKKCRYCMIPEFYDWEADHPNKEKKIEPDNLEDRVDRIEKTLETVLILLKRNFSKNIQEIAR